MSEEAGRDYQGSKIGMWLFLFTEFMLFGGLFILYAGSRALNPEAFHEASRELSVPLGVANTLILLTSSLFVAAALTAIQKGDRTLSMRLTGLTAACGALFLVNKGVEWGLKFQHGLYPNGPGLAGRPAGEPLFFGLYYIMTGLHGLHVLAGTALLVLMTVLLARGRVRQDDYVLLENSGLYWHLVDVIWIFLLPLFYLAA
ncbi:MAG: cytochrome C oxidase subunit III [Elusimicrobia bacterium GWA2_69_24]|nr:MAG: cytochrome C oxidase subunit III [Elusimicrobia bacterium GWA2_69_24]HBL16265.1 cytochrome C oxidase subunit III [Elusimicrobiota bacterium]